MMLCLNHIIDIDHILLYYHYIYILNYSLDIIYMFILNYVI